MGCLSHNFGSRHARRSIKGSENADDSPVFTKSLNQKNDSLGWRPGPVKIGQKFKNTPAL